MREFSRWLAAGVIALVSFSASPLVAQDQNPAPQTKKQKISYIRDQGKRDSAAIPSIANYLSDPDADVRDEAVKAIVNVGTQYSLDPLIRATRDNDPGIQIHATDGLVNFYVPGYVTTGGLSRTFTRVGKRIKNAFSSRNDQIVDAGVPVRGSVIEAIAPLVTGGASDDARANAARAEGVLRGKAALPELEKALQSKDSDLMFESLVALQKIRDLPSGESVAFLASDLDSRVQSTALETLGVLHVTDAAPQIRQALGRARNDKIRRAALEALAMLALPADRSIFTEYSTSKDADLRMSALEGLGRLRDPQDYPAIEAAFNDERELDPRLAAAFALVNEGNVDVTEMSPLRYLVNGLNLTRGNSMSTAYLVELCRRTEVRKSLLPLLPSATKDEKLGLIHALASTGDSDTAAGLEALTKDQDPDVAIAAVRSLKMIKTRLP